MKLLDFGLVQVTGEVTPPSLDAPTSPTEQTATALSGDVKLTHAGHIVGTPAYVSPEQARGDVVDTRSDIYSLGAVAYYLLTAQPPFLRATIAETLAAHDSEVPLPLRERDAAIDEDLAGVIMRCLEKNPERRYQLVQQLERDLNACRNAHSWDAEAARKWWQGRAPMPKKDEQKDADFDDFRTDSALLTIDTL